jgi:hypothetical protein
MPSANDKLPPESLDAQFIATVRCILTISVLLILALDPLARTCFYEVTYLILGLYVAYSALFYGAACWASNLAGGSRALGRCWLGCWSDGTGGRFEWRFQNDIPRLVKRSSISGEGHAPGR